MGIPSRQRLFKKLLKCSKLLLSWFTGDKWTLLAFLFLLLVKHRHSRQNSALLQGCVVKTLQLQFEGLHGEQLNLFMVWFQLTSLRSPLWNGCINIYNIIDNDKKIQQNQCKFELIMFTGWKWKFILYLNLFAAFIQAGKLDWMGACREYLNIQNMSSTGLV